MDEIETEHYASAAGDQIEVIAGRGSQLEVIAGWNPFRAIKKAITKVVHTAEDIAVAPLRLVSPKLARGAKGLLRKVDTMALKLAPVASMAIPFVGPGVAMLTGPALNLVKRVAKGDNVAKAAIASTLDLASQGNPAAKTMVQALTHARKIHKHAPHLSPQQAQTVSLATSPLLGPDAMPFIGPAANLLARAEQGDEQALQSIRQTLLFASQGNESAIKMAQALAIVRKLGNAPASPSNVTASGEWVAVAGCNEAFVPHAYSQTSSGRWLRNLGRFRPQHPYSDKQMRWAFSAEQRGEIPRGTALRWAHRNRLGPWRTASAGATSNLSAEDIAWAKHMLPRVHKSIADLARARRVVSAVFETCSLDEQPAVEQALKRIDVVTAQAARWYTVLQQCIPKLQPGHPTAVQGRNRPNALTMREALRTTDLVTS